MLPVGFKSDDLGTIENRHLRTFHIPDSQASFASTMFDVDLHLAKRNGYQKKILHSSEVLDDHLTNSSQHGSTFFPL